MNDAERCWPLGPPVNRPPPPSARERPIDGRLNWVVDSGGAEHYREPVKPPAGGGPGPSTAGLPAQAKP